MTVGVEPLLRRAAAVGVVLGLLMVPIGFELAAHSPTSNLPPGFVSESEQLFGSQAYPNYTFHGVTFSFHLWCAAGPAAGVVCGNATEALGAQFPYAFSDGPPSPAPAWQRWMAPDGHEAVAYLTGGHVVLSVNVR